MDMRVMKKPSINAAIFVLIICLTGTAWSAGSVAGSKATNFEGIKRIMSGKQFFSQQQERPYCVKLLKDLRNFKDMHLVEPIAGAENYEDPILNSYKERCGGLPLNEHFFCEGRGDTDDIWSDDPRERRQQLLASSCRQYISTRNFRVYELNIKTDNSNSLETLVFYSERACFVWAEGVSKYECTNGGYTVYYNDNCYVFGGTYTHDPYDYYYNRSLENYNGIILYGSLPFRVG